MEQINNSGRDKLASKAFKFHSEGNLLTAEKYYQLFIDKGFSDPLVFSNYAVILAQRGEINNAINLYKKSIKLFPNSPQAYSNLGKIFKDLGKLEEAECYIRKAIKIKPNYAEAYLNLGIIFIQFGKFLKAEEYTLKAIEIRPNYGMAYYNLGTIFKDQGKLIKAEKYTRKAIDINPNDINSLINLGSILIQYKKYNEAERCIRKAIEINPHFSKAYSNLASIFVDFGRFKEAEAYLIEAIKYEPYFARAYFSLSILKLSDKENSWQKKLFSKEIVENRSNKDLIDIYFARSNILHQQKKYYQSAENLSLGNHLKLNLSPSNRIPLIKKSKLLLEESHQVVIDFNKSIDAEQSIFIVGMPRSGSTLLESILSMNSEVVDFGEVNIFEEAFLEWKQSKLINNQSSLMNLYFRKLKSININEKITTNKLLYNYQYTGFILKHISNARIIHCFRNPLDNILSIFRANFEGGNEYSSSLVDCAKVYLDHDLLMSEYKSSYPKRIYNLNYDLLVNQPDIEIRSLTSWLGWDWNEGYLSPNLNNRTVTTASKVQVRSPINSKSIGGWKNYRNMLKPAIEVISTIDKFTNLYS